MKDHIVERIRNSGPLSIANFMEICLTHPELGYYTTRDPLGRGGDFITAPEISQMFGELIGLFLADYWLGNGQPEPLHLIELGPGRGTLMQDALRAMKIVPGLAEKVHVHFVEINPALKEIQKEAVPDANWADTLEDVPPGYSLIIANEFFDCLPIRQFVRTDSGWSERKVTEEDGKLVFTLDDQSVPANLSIGSSKMGDIKEVSPQSGFWVDSIASRLKSSGGFALVIDYGYAEPGFGETFQAVKDHKFIDVLAEPGESDLTAHVNFAALKGQAERAGLAVFGPIGQGDFLKQVGIEHRAGQLLDAASDKQKVDIISAVKRLVMGNEMGDLFKVLGLAKEKTPEPAGFEEMKNDA